MFGTAQKPDAEICKAAAKFHLVPAHATGIPKRKWVCFLACRQCQLCHRALHCCSLPVTVHSINACFGSLFQGMFWYEVRRCYVNTSRDKVCSHRLRPVSQVKFPSRFTVTVTAALPTPLPVRLLCCASCDHTSA